MMLAARGAIRASGAGLPYDAEVEYLESSGTQYLNTGIKPGPNTRVEITFAMTTFTANCGLFGARGNATADNNSYNLFIISNNGSRVRWDWSGSGQYQTSEAETSTDATYVLGAAGGNITRNGTTVMSVSASKSAINYPLYVFNFNNVGTPYSTGANARFWSVKIYDGQTLVFDAIPVRKKTVGYLYDRVSGKLFGNAGTGDFVLGPDVVPVEWLEGTGTQYIDTGIGYYADFEINVKMRTSLSNITLYSGGYNRLERISAALPYWRFRSNAGGTYDSTIPITELHTLAWRNGKIYSDGAEIYQLSKPYQNYEMYAFGTDTSAFPCVIYYLDLWDSTDTPVRKFRPVRVGTEGAMMDVLTRRIYRNAGTGAFSYGNDIKYPIPA